VLISWSSALFAISSRGVHSSSIPRLFHLRRSRDFRNRLDRAIAPEGGPCISRCLSRFGLSQAAFRNADCTRRWVAACFMNLASRRPIAASSSLKVLVAMSRSDRSTILSNICAYRINLARLKREMMEKRWQRLRLQLVALAFPNFHNVATGVTRRYARLIRALIIVIIIIIIIGADSGGCCNIPRGAPRRDSINLQRFEGRRPLYVSCRTHACRSRQFHASRPWESAPASSSGSPSRSTMPHFARSLSLSGSARPLESLLSAAISRAVSITVPLENRYRLDLAVTYRDHPASTIVIGG